MAQTGGADFTKWLNSKLRELKTDESVFGSYIIGILEGDETDDEKREALEEIISQIVEDGNEAILNEILDKWTIAQPKQEEIKKKPTDVLDIDTQLAKLLESKAIATTVQRQKCTPEEQRIREQILAQYSQVELEDDEDEDGVVTGGGSGGGGGGGGGGTNSSGGSSGGANSSGGGGGGGGGVSNGDPIMMKNTNALDVATLAKERREQAKIDSKAKKDKDKEDREKQKKDREEKKEKRKTVKGERRR